VGERTQSNRWRNLLAAVATRLLCFGAGGGRFGKKNVHILHERIHKEEVPEELPAPGKTQRGGERDFAAEKSTLSDGPCRKDEEDKSPESTDTLQTSDSTREDIRGPTCRYSPAASEII